MSQNRRNFIKTTIIGAAAIQIPSLTFSQTKNLHKKTLIIKADILFLEKAQAQVVDQKHLHRLT